MNLEDKYYWKSLINMAIIKFLIFRTLSRESMHGYKILSEISDFTQGCCQPTYGSIYPFLKELLDNEYAQVDEMTIQGRKRKVYRITEKGLSAYQAAKGSWEDILPYLNQVIFDE